MMLRLVRLCLLVCGTCYRQVTPVVRKSSSHVIHLIMSSPSGSQWKLNSFQWINGHSCLHLRNTSISSWPSCNRVFPMSSNRLLSESLQDCTVPFPGITWLSVGVICDSTSAGTTCNSILHIIIYESLELDLNWFQICMWMNDTLGTCMSANIIEMLQPLPSQWPCRATLSQVPCCGRRARCLAAPQEVSNTTLPQSWHHEAAMPGPLRSFTSSISWVFFSWSLKETPWNCPMRFLEALSACTYSSPPLPLCRSDI